MNNYQTNVYRPYSPSGITWVQGIEGAKAYQLMPNNNALLMDSENENIFYIKVADSIGMCNLRKFKFQEIIDVPKPPESMVDVSKFITRDELNEILNKRFNGGKNNGKQSIPAAKSETTEQQSTSNHAGD